MLVENTLDVGIKFVAGTQHVIQLVLTEYRTQRGLGKLTGGIVDIRHLNDGLFRIDDAEINDRIDFHRDIVAGDHVLRWHLHDHGTQVHLAHLLHDGYDEDDARSLDLIEASECENDATLIFLQHFESTEDDDGENDYDDQHKNTHWRSSSLDGRNGSTINLSPCRPITLTVSPV